MKRFVSSGTFSILGIFAVLLLILGVVGGGFVVSKNTGFVNFASGFSEVILTGTLKEQSPCALLGSQPFCFLLTDNIGTKYNLNSTLINLKKYVGKKVKITGVSASGLSNYLTVKNIEEVVINIPDTAESMVAEPADLGLIVTPSLNSELGRVDLKIKWTDLRKTANGDKLVGYRVTVRKMPTTNWQTNLIKVATPAKAGPTETEKVIASVPVESGKEYYVQLRAFYGQSGLIAKVQQVRFSYFEDRFENLSNWFIEGDVKIDEGQVILSSKNSRYSYIKLKNTFVDINLKHNFDLSLQNTLTSFLSTGSITPVSFSEWWISCRNNPLHFKVGNTELIVQNVDQQVFSIAHPVFPVTFRVFAGEGGIGLGVNNIVKSAPLCESVIVGGMQAPTISSRSEKGVTTQGSFDNFRLVWTK